MRPHASKLTITPNALDLLEIQAGGALKATLKEANYTGTFTEKNTCASIASVSAAGAGPSTTVTVTGLGHGVCAFTYSDKGGANKATLDVSVTTTTLALFGPLPSAANAIVKITPQNTTDTLALTNCTNGCNVNVPAKPGTDTFDVTVTDKNNKTLAIGNTAKDVVVTQGKATATQSITFLKVIATLVLPALPSGVAGTAFGSPSTVKLTAKDVDGNTIDGTYEHPITIADSDTSGATTVATSGSDSPPANTLLSSTDALTLNYSGLAIAPATLTASSTGVTSQKATFSPKLSPIVYTGPKTSGNPEVDLYSNVPSTSGFSGNFTATELGWTESPYNKALTYGFAAITGQTNNCPAASNPAYGITPASGTVGTPIVVSASSQLQAASDPSPFAGECMMTITGGGAQTQNVTLTFTSSSVGVGGRHRPKP